MVTPVHGFWSYSRATEDVGSADLHRAMRASLSDPMSLLGELQVYRDNDSVNGIPGGADWAREIVAALARSTLFFWVQSPRWLRAGSMCQFEYQVFRDRVDRIARQFLKPSSPLDADQLLEALLVPVRLVDMRDADWQRIDADVRLGFQREWQRRQVLPALNFPQLQTQSSVPIAIDNLAASCRAAAVPIARRYIDALTATGIDPRALNDFIENDRRAFEQRWLQHFEDRASQSAKAGDRCGREPEVEAQRQLAQRLAAGITRSHVSPLGVPLVLVPDATGEGGFWAGATPLPNRLASAFDAYLGGDGEIVKGPGGSLRCSRQAARRLLEPLAEAGLRLPTPLEASRLLALFALGSERAARLGFDSIPREFWCLDNEGRLHETTDMNSRMSLLLVAPLE